MVIDRGAMDRLRGTRGEAVLVASAGKDESISITSLIYQSDATYLFTE